MLALFAKLTRFGLTHLVALLSTAVFLFLVTDILLVESPPFMAARLQSFAPLDILELLRL